MTYFFYFSLKIFEIHNIINLQILKEFSTQSQIYFEFIRKVVRREMETVGIWAKEKAKRI